MPKVLTERVNVGKYSDPDEFKFSVVFDINIDKEGNFSTTLPEDKVVVLETAIKLKKNRLGRRGYFTDTTLKGLVAQVKAACEEYMSSELIEQKIIIKYSIQTTCAYCHDINGDIVPNAASEWTKFKERQPNDWQEGTLSQNSTSPRPFGFQVYAKPFKKQVYKYKSGLTREVFEEMTPFGNREAGEEQHYLYWLEEVCSTRPPKEGELMEIEYNEQVAKFFVEMIKSVCKLNDRIKEFVHPEAIKQIAESGGRFLGNG